MGGDNTDPASVSTAMIQGRKIAHAFQRSLADYLGRRSFSDEICRTAYYIDVHTVDTQRLRTRFREAGAYLPADTDRC